MQAFFLYIILSKARSVAGRAAAALSATRRPLLFAPLSPRTLVAPFRGAKSSHFRRRISPSWPPGGALSLLPSTREPLQLRFGEQNLHIPAAGFGPPQRPAPGARWLYASKDATAYPRKTKVNPFRLYFFCTSLKSGHFSPQNRLLGLFPCRMKFAKKFYSAILSIRKDALGALYFYAWHFAHLRRACAPLSPSAPLLKLCVL